MTNACKMQLWNILNSLLEWLVLGYDCQCLYIGGKRIIKKWSNITWKRVYVCDSPSKEIWAWFFFLQMLRPSLIASLFHGSHLQWIVSSCFASKQEMKGNGPIDYRWFSKNRYQKCTPSTFNLRSVSTPFVCQVRNKELQQTNFRRISTWIVNFRYRIFSFF